jgi:hypothetical protein
MQRTVLTPYVHCYSGVLNGGKTKKCLRMPYVRICLKDRKKKIVEIRLSIVKIQEWACPILYSKLVFGKGT